MGTPTLVCVWSCPNFSAPAGRPFSFLYFVSSVMIDHYVAFLSFRHCRGGPKRAFDSREDDMLAVVKSRLEALHKQTKLGYGGFDEARMLQSHFNGTSVKFGKPIPERRVFDKFGVAILDDGIQHISMWYDQNIVMVNALSPWGDRHLIPFGPLGEPLTAFYRVDAAVISHADMVQSILQLNKT
ncbi:probable tetraacyldisaccharide 4'-kinase, mitochondrial isoform X2 [Tanacetum coccineum]